MDNKSFLIATIGHTAAGKTTLSRSIVEQINVSYIEEGKIKRNIIGAYKTADSLNEGLRDIAYGKAISIAKSELADGKSVLIDASFHKLKRRSMVYDMLSSSENSIPLVWLYCYCPDIQKVTRRINERKTAIKTAATQADSMDIYYHIVQSFDLPDIANIPDTIEAAIITINTDANEIEGIQYNNNTDSLKDLCEKLCNHIHKQLLIWRYLK